MVDEIDTSVAGEIDATPTDDEASVEQGYQSDAATELDDRSEEGS
jgi:hypothetical protein